jgi:tripartite ATP-independent transporter DctP family solute receptor
MNQFKIVFLITVFSAAVLGSCLKTNTPVASGPDAAAAAKPSDKTTTLKFAHFSNEMHPIHTGTTEFAKSIQEKTNGALAIEIYPNNELGSPMELLEQVSLGNIDFTLGTLSDLGRYSQRFYAVQMPFIFESYDHAHAILDSAEFNVWSKPDLDKNNFHGLGFWEYGFRNLTTKGKVINSPADLKGVKVRVPKVAQLEECFAALGATTEKIDYNELYLAMKQGVADGQENPIGVIKADKLYEVQDQLIITNHMYESVLLIMNSRSWDKLTDEQKRIIEQEANISGARVRDIVISSEKGDIEELKDHGMTVTYPDLEKFKAMMGAAYTNIAKVCGQENVDTMVRFTTSKK